MALSKQLIDRIFSIDSDTGFESVALEVFRLQARSCPVYRDWLRYSGIDPSRVETINEIPYLPIEFFKSQEIIADGQQSEQTFTSSSTSGIGVSRHLVSDLSLYRQSFRQAFEYFYGGIEQYALLALLPSYLEREGSSLIFMVDELIKNARPESGYFLYNQKDLYEQLSLLKASGTPTLLIGVTYALLDFAETHAIEFPELIVMETGGMKGRRHEMVREELHQILCDGFGVPVIHSEYGMTELLSQAYSKGGGIFHCPPWMKVLIRDTNDPYHIMEPGKTGAVNIVDLANINSCCFLATQDLGRIYEKGTFEILGRFDNSDIRGCNLLVQ